MDYIVSYRNAGYGDAQDVVITTNLPTGTTYAEVGHGWQPAGEGIYTYAVGPLGAGSTTRTITFTVVHTDTPEVAAPAFNTPFTIALRGGAEEDDNPNDNATYVRIGVPDLVVDDLRVEPGPASVQPNVPVSFTFTITLMNQGTGVAWDPDTTGDFYVDVFTAPVASHPFQRYGAFPEACEPISPGLRSPPLVITSPVITPSERGLVFYVKVDNHERYPYGSVPEFDEMNNVAAWPPRVLLPLVLRNYQPWDEFYEENDHWLRAYGPLTSGQTYLAYPDDDEDYYYFTLSATATVNITVTNFAPSSSDGTVMLYGSADGDKKDEDYIDYYGDTGHSDMSLGPHLLGPDKYYIRVYTDERHSTTQLYRLTVTY
jgi:hypothetical protein